MESNEIRSNLDQIIHERGESYVILSRLIGRNDAYIQQFIKRGSPKKLEESDRRTISRYLGVCESILGGPERIEPNNPNNNAPKNINLAEHPNADMVTVPILDIGASAGAGAFDRAEMGGEYPRGHVAFDPLWLRSKGMRSHKLSMILVEGESMEPTLPNGADILIDHQQSIIENGHIYVLRHEGQILVKRLLRDKNGGLLIRSDNNDYADIYLTDIDNIQIIGRVIWYGRYI
ncbi:hypothetical protein LPB140_04265 [Sphingorhabdus lutea]|uniref:Peptidase S24/S26A/S26B/S26C domain-containing protein n=1 Tax=Sphingorhabdus lutea TaxID=1913578 RepID=A0A1L3JAI5_9SPHN|nr:helix-turn-helix transcriptional regulator [Sphingorhabdus lutea]APG62150.1 hypothetical protein LPB140_04265 [Sphingorhabdus lutea]